MESTAIEKENLEAHVELCAERYKQLETKLDTVSTRLDKVDTLLEDIRTTVNKNAATVQNRFINTSNAAVTVLFSSVVGLITFIFTKL